MSKHFHNYNQQYNHNKPVAPVAEEVTAAVTEEAIVEETVEEVVNVEPVVEETVEEVVEENTVYGTVECKEVLNVRKAPAADAAVICVIKNGSEVIIDVTNSTDDFYKVCTEAGLEGYCMKKFIKVD